MRTLFIIPLVLMSLVSLPSQGETLTMDDLALRNDLHYKKFTNVPFTVEISGIDSGKIKKGRKIGEWLYYHENGQLKSKENYKDVNLNFSEYFNEDGSLKKTETWTDGVKVSD